MEESKLRQIPSVDRILSDGRIVKLKEHLPHELVVNVIQSCLEDIRHSVSSGGTVPSMHDIATLVIRRATHLDELSLQPVINATGVILHTNLGRAPLSVAALQAMEEVARGYCNLELDLDSGERGIRSSRVESLLCQITGAAAALVVNNNAAAILLALSALAKKKEVIVSRGQAIQIGGGFRIPEVMRQSGARLVEVGTTNCTYLEDYEEAITDRTAVLFRAHSSNFKISGFVHSVSLDELVELGKRHNLLVLDDLGSGCLIDVTKFGLESEPMVQESIKAGASLVFFSGDKLLGGPQSGIILGERELITRLGQHSLNRAMRIDKVGLAGLAATLRHYLRGEAMETIPVLRMIATPSSELKKRSTRWAQSLGEVASVVAGESVIGGGSLPESTLPSWLLVIRPSREVKIEELAQRLRRHKPPIIVRVAKNSLLLDPRGVFPEDDEVVIKALQEELSALEYAI